MQEDLFRKKSLDKVKSPDTLDEYIRVSNPGVWLLLVSLIVLLVGVCVWGIFGHIDSTVSSAVYVKNGEAVCYIAEEDIASVSVGSTVKFDDAKATITEIGEKGELGYLCKLSMTADSFAADGFYEGETVIKSYNPLSFILN